MYSGKSSKKKIWSEIAENMNGKAYAFTWRQCETKWNTLKKTYKSVRDHNKKSGNSHKEWKYFEVSISCNIYSNETTFYFN